MDGSPDRTTATNRAGNRRTNEPSDCFVDPSLGLTGVFNFRDLASAQGASGPLRRGLVYRADGINRCRTEETSIIAGLGVRRVLDLRTDTERSADGVFEHPDIVTVHVPMLENLESLADRLGELGDDLMPEFYLSIAATNSGAIALCIAEMIASAFDNEPLIFHCTGGKDRTGIVAALALALVGVDDHLIALDYAKSASAIPRLNRWYRERRGGTRIDQLADDGFDEHHRAQLLSASPTTMLAFLAGIRHHYGSVEDFLAWGGTDRAELHRVHAALA